MKKLLLLFIFLFPLFSFGYQQQGFKDYKENLGAAEFDCQSQCIMLIGATDQYDIINLNGEISGQGVIGYGFLIGQQVAPGDVIQVNGNTTIDKDFVFSKAQVFKQIPANSQVVLIMQGNLKGKIKPTTDILGIGQKISMGFKDFWSMETLTPYSINLRYGAKILGTSVLQYGYWLFIIVTLYILVFSKERKNQKFKKIFFWGLGIFLFIGIRNFIGYTWIVNQGIRNYSNQTIANKTFFDLGDYITFTYKIRESLDLDNTKKSCKVQINSIQDRPFKVHRDNLYIKPCTSVITGSEADYIIYYKKPISNQDTQKPVLVDFNGSYLLQNK